MYIANVSSMLDVFSFKFGKWPLLVVSNKHIHVYRPFPSYLVPLFQSESIKCKTILMKMTLICMKIKLLAKLIFIWKVLHFDLFWTRDTRELRNGLNCTPSGLVFRRSMVTEHFATLYLSSLFYHHTKHSWH